MAKRQRVPQAVAGDIEALLEAIEFPTGLVPVPREANAIMEGFRVAEKLAQIAERDRLRASPAGAGQAVGEPKEVAGIVLNVPRQVANALPAP